jgi:hypothetical protein
VSCVWIVPLPWSSTVTMCASWTPTSHPATRRLVSDIRTLTDKPIRYVVNTHWHYHHTDGNQVFGPGVRIIGHENTRKTILAGVLHKRLEQAFRDLPNALANTRKRLAAEQNPSAKERFSGSSRYRRHIRRSSKRPSGICGARRKRYTSRRCRWLKLPSGST